MFMINSFIFIKIFFEIIIFAGWSQQHKNEKDYKREMLKFSKLVKPKIFGILKTCTDSTKLT